VVRHNPPYSGREFLDPSDPAPKQIDAEGALKTGALSIPFPHDDHLCANVHQLLMTGCISVQAIVCSRYVPRETLLLSSLNTFIEETTNDTIKHRRRPMSFGPVTLGQEVKSIGFPNRIRRPRSSKENTRMTSLSTHGTERFRLVKSRPPLSDSATEERKTVSIRSDGSVFSNLEVKFKPDSLNPNGRWHSYFGWSRVRMVPPLTPEAARDTFLKHGYTLVENA
jgi:hypothetical protein